MQPLVKRRKHGRFRFCFLPFDNKGVIVFGGEDADAVFEQLLEADVDVDDVEAQEGTITVYTAPTDLHKAIVALRESGIEEFQVTELEMIPQSEVELSGEDLETFENFTAFLKTTKTSKRFIRT